MNLRLYCNLEKLEIVFNVLKMSIYLWFNYYFIYILSSRYKLRGIRHIIFYELPRYPHFYSEVCNMLKDIRRQADKENLTCSVLYSSFDAQRLADIAGTDRAARMISSTKKVHMFVTGENS